MAVFVATVAQLADLMTRHSCSQVFLFHGINTATVAMRDTVNEFSKSNT
jgi:hypothetical protein